MSYLLHFSALVRTEIEKKHIPKCIHFRSTFRKGGLYLKKVTHTVLRYANKSVDILGQGKEKCGCRYMDITAPVQRSSILIVAYRKLSGTVTSMRWHLRIFLRIRRQGRITVLVEDVLRLGDILIVTELDRLGRNKHDTMQQIQRIKDMGVRLMVLELPTTLMDLSVMDNAMARMMLETINNMMLELYASMAQAELEKKEKRQREGIEAKKLRGEWDDYGRPSVMKQETFDENFQSVISGKMTPTQLRKSLGMTHSTFYRYRKTFYEKYPELSNT